MILYFSF